MQIQNIQKCEKCSMDANYEEVLDGVKHYYCEHHRTDNPVISLNVAGYGNFKRLYPLLSMFAVIGFLTIFTAFFQKDLSGMNLMILMMAYFFIVFGGFKVINLKNFTYAYMTYDIIAMKSKFYAFAFPFIEITLGIMYFFYIGGVYRDIFTFILMSIGTVGIWNALKNKDEIPCACLGMVFNVPMTKVTLFENLFMAMMALYMVVAYLAMSGNMTM
jgi:hypothetical protein